MPCNLVVRACCAMAGQVLLSACTVSPTPGGGYQISTPPAISLFSHSDPNGDNSTTGSPLAGEPTDDSPGSGGQVVRGLATSFAGELDGGKGTAKLRPIGGSKYRLNLQVTEYGADGQITGAGAVQGTLSRIGDVFTMSAGYDQRPPLSPCALNLTLRGSILTVSEDYRRGGCNAFHGASVSFDGQLSAVQ